MAGKIKAIKEEFLRQLTIISVSFTIIVHLLYISYLRFALRHSIGNRAVNFVLVMATALFLVVYLIFRVFIKNRNNVKRTKRIYRRFKLIAKLFTVGIAIYTIATAVGSVSPFAALFAMINAIVLIIRLIFELIIAIITRGIRRVKNSVKERITLQNSSDIVDGIELDENEYSEVKITADDL